MSTTSDAPSVPARDPAAGEATVPADGPRPVVPALLLLALGIAGIVLSIRLPILEENGAGPGLWPLLICIVMTATAAVVVLCPPLRVAIPTARRDVLRVVGALVLLGGFAVLLPAIGLVSTSIIVGALWLRLLTRDSWATSLGVPAGVALVLYVIFVKLLEVPVPVDAWLPR